jgi:predicted protein tyrosine phosphatase
MGLSRDALSKHIRSKVHAMKTIATSLLTICGLEELDHHSRRGVTHVLSILDPEWPDPEAFTQYDLHHRTTLKFHDVIEPGPGLILPQAQHVEEILKFGNGIITDPTLRRDPHLLVHCHMGVSRSTAAMAILIAQSNSSESDEAIFARLLELRPQAWPNSRMIGFADQLLGRGGGFLHALGALYATQLSARPEFANFMRTHGRTRELELAARRGRHGQMEERTV